MVAGFVGGYFRPTLHNVEASIYIYIHYKYLNSINSSFDRKQQTLRFTHYANRAYHVKLLSPHHHN